MQSQLWLGLRGYIFTHKRLIKLPRREGGITHLTQFKSISMNCRQSWTADQSRWTGQPCTLHEDKKTEKGAKGLVSLIVKLLDGTYENYLREHSDSLPVINTN